MQQLSTTPRTEHAVKFSTGTPAVSTVTQEYIKPLSDRDDRDSWQKVQKPRSCTDVTLLVGSPSFSSIFLKQNHNQPRGCLRFFWEVFSTQSNKATDDHWQSATDCIMSAKIIMDMEHVSPATRLLEKRRRMFEVNEQLERQKQQFERQEVLIPVWSSDTFYVWFGYAQVRARVQFRFLIICLDTFINIILCRMSYVRLPFVRGYTLELVCIQMISLYMMFCFNLIGVNSFILHFSRKSKQN